MVFWLFAAFVGDRKRAFQIIEEEEEKGLAQTKMQPGFDELMAFLAEQKIERGVVTRNSRTAVDHVFPTPDEYFSVVLTRDFDGMLVVMWVFWSFFELVL